MRKTGFIFALVLCAALMTGCAEKKEQAQEREGATVQSAPEAERPAEIKDAPPVAPVEPEKKAAAEEEKAGPLAAPEEKAVKKQPVEEKAAEKPVEEKTAKAGAAGALTYKSKCSPCHGPDGGGSVMAPAIKGNEWVRDASSADIAEVIKNGRQGTAKKYPNFVVSMPASKNMPDDDLDALVEYIKSLN